MEDVFKDIEYYREEGLINLPKNKKITKNDIIIPFKRSVPITIHCFLYSKTFYSYDEYIGIIVGERKRESGLLHKTEREIEWIEGNEGIDRKVYCSIIPFSIKKVDNFDRISNKDKWYVKLQHLRFKDIFSL